MQPLWTNRYELKPGRYVYVPTKEAREIGIVIKKAIASRWTPPPYMYQFRPGGHVAALRPHLGNSFFLLADLRDCFGSINRTRVTRRLTSLFGYQQAREWARLSVVPDPRIPGQFMLPYGFVQSPIIAALCLAGSTVGSFLKRLSRSNDAVPSSYVDDIIVSTSCLMRCTEVHGQLLGAIEKAEFQLNQFKSLGPASMVRAFNIELAHQSLSISGDRMTEFQKALATASSINVKEGVRGYVESVNPNQCALL